ncbi:hypothetical protein [Rhodococcus sp. ARC_M6]|uniref:hypothetical protein n=1 Tax=Rhodococcus sp. ARC_M6 TaxID=2928852 RepID=UPI001FB31040|nr:hypothetical protein [Rhodococcus sp. ARC_M6]MCJ0901931.1 hypothetical protein [Rhodococcus sp. ARC_M6]
MKTQYKWAIAASSVLLIGFVSVQQTGALWRDSVEATGGGTITAGLLDISAGTDGVKQFNLDGFKLENKGPGDSIQMPLPVINSGNVQMSYTLSDVVLNGATPPPLTLRVTKVANEAACTAISDGGTDVLYSGAMDGAAFAQSQLVPAGQMQVLCLRATLDPGAAAAQESNATFTFAASSVSQQ